MNQLFGKLLTIGILGSALTFAQRTPPDPATLVQHQVARLTELLSLTTAQQAQATTIFTASVTANETVMTSLTQARTTLAAAIKANDAGGITAAAASIGTLTGQSTATSAKADAAFYAILTADQQAKYHPGTGGFGGGPGGPGGGFRGQMRRPVQ